MPPLPADSIHARACKLKCEKILTRPKAGLDFRGRIEYNSTRKGVAGRRLAPTYH